MFGAWPPLSLSSNLEAEYTAQWVSEGSTSESEKSKQKGMTPLVVTQPHLWCCLSI
jgi:hypothetical protein